MLYIHGLFACHLEATDWEWATNRTRRLLSPHLKGNKKWEWRRSDGGGMEGGEVSLWQMWSVCVFLTDLNTLLQTHRQCCKLRWQWRCWAVTTDLNCLISPSLLVLPPHFSVPSPCLYFCLVLSVSLPSFCSWIFFISLCHLFLCVSSTSLSDWAQSNWPVNISCSHLFTR